MPTNKSLNDQMSAMNEAFSRQIAELARGFATQMVQAMTDTLRGGLVATNGKRPSAALSKTTAAGRGPGAQTIDARTPEGKAKLAQLTAEVTKYIRDNAGKNGVRIEEIGKGMGLPTSVLTGAVNRGLAAKTITKKGQRRATRYFPGKR